MDKKQLLTEIRAAEGAEALAFQADDDREIILASITTDQLRTEYRNTFGENPPRWTTNPGVIYA